MDTLQTVAVAVVMFVATNADDLVLLALFFSQPKCSVRSVVFGQLAGIGVLTIVSYAAAVLALAIPHGWLPLLGIVPLLIGFRWLRRPITSDSANTEVPQTMTWLSVAGVTLANGADNLGVYIPAFAAQTGTQKLITGLSFLLLTLVWCVFAYQAVRHSAWGDLIQRISCHRSLQNQPPRVTKKPATPKRGEQRALLFQQAPYQPLGMEFVGKEVRVRQFRVAGSISTLSGWFEVTADNQQASRALGSDSPGPMDHVAPLVFQPLVGILSETPPVFPVDARCCQLRSAGDSWLGSGAFACRPHSKPKQNHRTIAVRTMATSAELPASSTATNARSTSADATLDELAQLKRQLLQAEVRLAKSRANAAGAEADVKVLSARLRAVSSKGL